MKTSSSRDNGKVKYVDALALSSKGYSRRDAVASGHGQDFTGSIVERRAFRNLDNLEIGYLQSTSSNNAKMLLGTKPGNLGEKRVTKPSSKPSGKVKENQTTSVSELQKELHRREEIKKMMALFIDVRKILFQDKSHGQKMASWVVLGIAAKIVKEKMKLPLDVPKIEGLICGVSIGDVFEYRAQLQMIGLHCQPQCGIDYINNNGYLNAISVVDSPKVLNKRESANALFSGHGGGVKFMGSKQIRPEDQKLEKGNLALMNNMKSRRPIPVRVIRKIARQGYSKEVFVYDGLYTVEGCKRERGDGGKIVFKFKLNRNRGQPDLCSMLNA